ncbi:MAG TPA: hypothetical protein VKZ88_01580 [Fibrobacteria bacterium]|nr:hypothetical protein [Fibrobacteria bacterium]
MQTHFLTPARKRALPFSLRARALRSRRHPECMGVFTGCLLWLAAAVTAQTSPAPGAMAASPARPPDSTVAVEPGARPADSAGEAPAVRDAPPAFRIYNLEDDQLLRDLWRHAGRTGEPDPGRYQILAVTDTARPAEPTMLLLREGTQSGHLPPATQAWLRERLRTESAGGGTARSLGVGLWANFWNPFDRLAPYQWETGLTVTARGDGATFQRSKPLFGQHYDLVFTHRPVLWLTTEMGAHVTRQGGGLYRNLYDPLDAGGKRWTGYTPWWHAAIGVPGVKWEVSLSNRLFPEYVWLDPQAGDGSYQAGLAHAGLPPDTGLKARGLLMKRWRAGGGDPRPSGNNLAHSLHLKAGNFRYMAHFDPDVYRSVIQQLMIEDISAPFGQWAFGFITAEGVAHSRLRLDLAPLHGKPGPAALNARARAFLLRLHFDYRDASTYRLGFSTFLHLDTPFLRPGVTP